jgi:hypothetical protein
MLQSDRANLRWSAPGDDGGAGTTTSYVIRWATTPINNDTDFAAAPKLLERLHPSQRAPRRASPSPASHPLQRTTLRFAPSTRRQTRQVSPTSWCSTRPEGSDARSSESDRPALRCRDSSNKTSEEVSPGSGTWTASQTVWSSWSTRTASCLEMCGSPARRTKATTGGWSSIRDRGGSSLYAAEEERFSYTALLLRTRTQSPTSAGPSASLPF